MILENFPLKRLIGGALACMFIAFGFGLFLIFLIYNKEGPKPPFFREAKPVEKGALSFSLKVVDSLPELSFHKAKGDLSLREIPLRPGSLEKRPGLYVRLKKNGLIKRVQLPASVGLKVDLSGNLLFEEKSPYWAEIREEGGRYRACFFAKMDNKEPFLIEELSLVVEEVPFSEASGLAPSSPFHLLSEAKLLGRDLLKERFGVEVYRVEIGSVVWDLSPGDFLGFIEGDWRRVDSFDPEYLVEIKKKEGGSLYFEGWEGKEPLRLLISPALNSPFKPKTEELFGAVRIRSEKQVSCLIEKQCLVLKVGDWALKKEGKWKVLKKQLDREAVVRGDLVGDLFIFERIESKQGQKLAVGSFYNLSRTQMASIELPGGLQRKTTKEAKKRGKNR